MLADWYRYRTHCVVRGTTQSGKSKFAEFCIRQHVMDALDGVCLIDWHGTLYDQVLAYLAYHRPTQPVILVNPSQPDYITPFNPFQLTDGGDPTAHAARQADVLVKCWGSENSDLMPTFERMAKMVTYLSAVTGEPIHHCVRLLEMPKRELREYAISLIDDDYFRQQWTQLQYVKTFREWVHEVQSTQNRLARFVGSKGVKLFTGLPGQGLNVNDAIEQGAILLVNLKPSGNLSQESGKVFAGLLLSEFLFAALNNTNRERPYYIYCDESQNYLTPDAAAILDQVIKTGMRLTLLHHHDEQFHDNRALLESVRTNARIKVTFGGLSVNAAKEAAEELFLPKINERWIKEINYHTITKHTEEAYEVISETEGVTWGEFESDTFSHSDSSSSTTGSESFSSHTSGTVGERETESDTSGGGSSSSSTESWSTSFGGTVGRSHGGGRSKSVSRSTRFRPYYELEETGKVEWARDEKVSIIAQQIISLPQRHCFLKFPDDVYEWEVPWVEPALLSDETVLEFIQTIQSTPLHEAEQIIREEEARFLKRAEDYERSRSSRPKKRTPTLAPQGRRSDPGAGSQVPIPYGGDGKRRTPAKRDRGATPDVPTVRGGTAQPDEA